MMWAKRHRKVTQLTFGPIKSGKLKQEREFLAGDALALKELRFFSPGYYRTYPDDAKTYHPPPYNRGFVEAAFRVLESTNTGSKLLPTRFEFRTFAPIQHGTNAVQLGTVSHWQMTVTNIGPARGGGPPLDIGATVKKPIEVVKDERFSDHRRRYRLTNALWLPKTDPRLSR